MPSASVGTALARAAAAVPNGHSSGILKPHRFLNPRMAEASEVAGQRVRENVMQEFRDLRTSFDEFKAKYTVAAKAADEAAAKAKTEQLDNMTALALGAEATKHQQLPPETKDIAEKPKPETFARSTAPGMMIMAVPWAQPLKRLRICARFIVDRAARVPFRLFHVNGKAILDMLAFFRTEVLRRTLVSVESHTAVCTSLMQILVLYFLRSETTSLDNTTLAEIQQLCGRCTSEIDALVQQTPPDDAAYALRTATAGWLLAVCARPSTPAQDNHAWTVIIRLLRNVGALRPVLARCVDTDALADAMDAHPKAVAVGPELAPLLLSAYKSFDCVDFVWSHFVSKVALQVCGQVKARVDMVTQLVLSLWWRCSSSAAASGQRSALVPSMRFHLAIMRFCALVCTYMRKVGVAQVSDYVHVSLRSAGDILQESLRGDGGSQLAAQVPVYAMLALMRSCMDEPGTQVPPRPDRVQALFGVQNAAAAAAKEAVRNIANLFQTGNKGAPAAAAAAAWRRCLAGVYLYAPELAEDKEGAAALLNATMQQLLDPSRLVACWMTVRARQAATAKADATEAAAAMVLRRWVVDDLFALAPHLAKALVTLYPLCHDTTQQQLLASVWQWVRGANLAWRWTTSVQRRSTPDALTINSFTLLVHGKVQRRATQIVTSQFLAVTMFLEGITKQPLLFTPRQYAMMFDILSYLEFARVDFTAYNHLLRRLFEISCPELREAAAVNVAPGAPASSTGQLPSAAAAPPSSVAQSAKATGGDAAEASPDTNATAAVDSIAAENTREDARAEKDIQRTVSERVRDEKERRLAAAMHGQHNPPGATAHRTLPPPAAGAADLGKQRPSGMPSDLATSSSGRNGGMSGAPFAKTPAPSAPVTTPHAPADIGAATIAIFMKEMVPMVSESEFHVSGVTSLAEQADMPMQSPPIATSTLPRATTQIGFLVQMENVSVGRDFYLMGLLRQWLPQLELHDVCELCCPLSYGYFAHPVAALNKRAHALFQASYEHVVTTSDDRIELYFYRDFALQLLPHYTRVITHNYPMTVQLSSLANHFLTLFRVLPDDDPLTLYSLRVLLDQVLLLLPHVRLPNVVASGGEDAVPRNSLRGFLGKLPQNAPPTDYSTATPANASSTSATAAASGTGAPADGTKVMKHGLLSRLSDSLFSSKSDSTSSRNTSASNGKKKTDASKNIVTLASRLEQADIPASFRAAVGSWELDPKRAFGACATLVQLYMQLVQLVPIDSFAFTLSMLREVLEVSEPAKLRGALATVVHAVISRNFDLYYRDYAVKWYLQTVRQLGITADVLPRSAL